MIAQKNYAGFWDFHDKYKPKGYFCDDFKSLINSMLALNPGERLNLEGVINHPWMKGVYASDDERGAEFKLRGQAIKDKKKKNAET